MRDKPDGFVCCDAGGDGTEGVSDVLLDVLVAGVGMARIGVEHRWFGNGGGTPDNDSLGNKPPNKQIATAITRTKFLKKKSETNTRKMLKRKDGEKIQLKIYCNKDGMVWLNQWRLMTHLFREITLQLCSKGWYSHNHKQHNQHSYKMVWIHTPKPGVCGHNILDKQ